jgi:hypothetical protein
MKITLTVAFLPCAVAPGALRGVLYEAAEAARSLMDITGGSDSMRSTNNKEWAGPLLFQPCERCDYVPLKLLLHDLNMCF